MPKIEIKVGDIVQLKSGGPYMTVEKIGDYDAGKAATCVWFPGGDSSKASVHTFALATLAHPPDVTPDDS